MQRISKVNLSTIAACGDVNRNIMCCRGLKDAVHTEMQQLADTLATFLEPRTKAYYEIWIKDEQSGEETLAESTKADEEEPLYGKTYLPRKFKTAIALPEDNCVDVYTNDLGYIAVVAMVASSVTTSPSVVDWAPRPVPKDVSGIGQTSRIRYAGSNLQSPRRSSRFNAITVIVPIAKWPA